MNDTYDRLGDLDLRSDGFENQDLASDLGKPIRISGDNNPFVLGGDPAPRHGQTLSEICDNEERDAVFNHTMQSGVFSNIKNSPLKEKLPPTLQVWAPGDSQGFKTFGKTIEPSAQFSKYETTKPADHLSFKADFNFNPKKFYCLKHPNREVEYCNEISAQFYCRACLP